MEIVHIAAELAPVAKVGGLGDVVHGLSRALINKKHAVKVLLPKYNSLDAKWIKDLKLSGSLDVQFDDRICKNTLWQGSVDTIPVIFIESQDGFFDRGTIYGCKDDITRFSYFCMAAVAYLRQFPCGIIHIHDWHTALIAGLVKDQFPDMKAKIILTIHNLAYQGRCQKEDLLKVHWTHSALKEDGHYNLLKGGVVFADHITTVSPTYAQEILTPEYGCGLQGTLRAYQTKITGVLNGIDADYWNPQTDPLLPVHYSIESLEHKEKMKRELKKHLSLAQEDSPLVGAITRLVPQKGPELIKAALLRTLEWRGQFVLLGSALDEQTHIRFCNLKSKLAGNPHVHFELTFNEELSHLFFAAADLFLVPSIFEPCGLTQQIAMRYGAVPLVRKTGGLADTVFDGINGFTFGPPTAEAIHEALDRAFKTWYEEPYLWKKMVETGMGADYSWNKPANEYLRIYSGD